MAPVAAPGAPQLAASRCAMAASPKLASAEPIVSVHCRTNGSSLVAQLLAQKADEAVSCMETEEHSCIRARTH